MYSTPGTKVFSSLMTSGGGAASGTFDKATSAIGNSWKVGDMTAVNDSEFLVIEHSAKKGDNVKHIWKFNIAHATPITAEPFDGKTLEELSDSAGLTKYGIQPVKKELFFGAVQIKKNGNRHARRFHIEGSFSDARRS